MKKRTIALIMAAVMLVGVAVGGTIAWLTAKSEDVVNTFTVGDINIELDEAPLNDDGITLNYDVNRVKANDNYKMIPGNALPKDPQVRVLDGSEACWLFVKIERSNNFDKYLAYDVFLTAENANDVPWKRLDGVADVYYREVSALTAPDNTDDAEFYILHLNQVKVHQDVTKEDMAAIDGIDANGSTTSDAALAEVAARPKLTFTAYAVQKDNVADVATAWQIANS